MTWYTVWPGGPLHDLWYGMVYRMALRAWNVICYGMTLLACYGIWFGLASMLWYGLAGIAWSMVWLSGPCI